MKRYLIFLSLLISLLACTETKAQTSQSGRFMNGPFASRPSCGSLPNAANGDVWNDTDDASSYKCMSNAWVAFGSTGGDLLDCGPNYYADVRCFGKFTTLSSTTVNTTSGSPTVTVASAQSFKNGEFVAIPGAGASCGLSTPGTPTVSPSVNAGGTSVVTGPTGASAFSYQVIAADKLGCWTIASNAGSTATGNTLGRNSATITTITRSNTTVTVTTSAAHGFVVNQMIHIKYFTSSDLTFEGSWKVATVPSSTTFTFVSGYDTRLGATTSATGGTVIGFNGNTVTWTPVTNAWKYYIYGRSGGTFNLLGQTIATSFTDYGSPMNDNQTFPAYIPTSAPITGGNDKLVAKINSGGGTTSLTLSLNAGATVTGAAIASDDSQPLILASASSPRVLVPVGGITLNSYTLIPSSTNVYITLNGDIASNDTLEFQGGAIVESSAAGNVISFGLHSGRSIVGTAFPQLVTNAAFNLNRVLVNCPAANGCLNEYNFQGTNISYDYSDFSTGNGNTTDYLGMNMIIATGGFSYRFHKSTFQTGTPGPNNNSNIGESPIPSVLLTLGIGNSTPTNDIAFDSCWFVQRGSVAVDLGSVGINWVIMKDIQIQSAVVPILQFTNISQTTAITPGGIDIQNMTIADRATAYVGHYANATNTGGVVTLLHVTPNTGGHNILTGLPFSSVVSEDAGGLGATNTNISGGNVSTDFSLSSILLGVPLISPSVSFNAVVSAGGSLSVAAHSYSLQYIDVAGRLTPFGPITIATTTPGNQTVTLTPVTPPTGVIQYQIVRDGLWVRLSGGSCNFGNNLNVAFVDDGTTVGCGSPQPATGASVSAMTGSAVSGPAFIHVNNGFSSSTTIPNALTAPRSTVIPNGNYVLPLAGTLTTTAAASDNVTIQGVTSSSHCSLTATSSTAATDSTGTFVSAKASNQITVTHPANAGRTWDIFCSAN